MANTTISHSGELITEVSGGQTATLKCAGMLMVGDVVVAVPEVEASDPVLQEKTVTENGEYTPDEGYDGLSKVTVDVPVPEGYIIPEGTVTITEDGTFDVTQYASAEVNVPSEEPVLEEITITENGEYTPSGDGYSKVTVEVEAEDSAVPIEVATEAEMTALLTSGEVGGVYKYTGETGAYENGALYVLKADALAGTWVFNDFSSYSGVSGANFLIYSDTSYDVPVGCFKRYTNYDTFEEIIIDCSCLFNGKYIGLATFNGTATITKQALFGYNGSRQIVLRTSIADSIAYGETTLEIYDTVKNVSIDSNFLTWLQANATKTATVKTLVKLIDQTALPQLYAPTITLDGDTLTITANADNGAFATSYDLYVDSSLVGNYTSTTIDLTTLELAEGTYSIMARAKGTNFADSADSAAVSYEVAA